MSDKDLVEFYRMKACQGDAQAAIAFAALWQALMVETYGERITEQLYEIGRADR